MAQIEVRAEVTGKVWKVMAPAGTQVEADEAILIVESMKMEIPVTSEKGGQVVELMVGEGDTVDDGQVVALLQT